MGTKRRDERIAPNKDPKITCRAIFGAESREALIEVDIEGSPAPLYFSPKVMARYIRQAESAAQDAMVEAYLAGFLVEVVGIGWDKIPTVLEQWRAWRASNGKDGHGPDGARSSWQGMG